jgi:hypothetical protein
MDVLGGEPPGNLLREVVHRLAGRLLHGELDLDNAPDRLRIRQRDLATKVRASKIGEGDPGESAPVGIAGVVRKLDIADPHRLARRRVGANAPGQGQQSQSGHRQRRGETAPAPNHRQ